MTDKRKLEAALFLVSKNEFTIGECETLAKDLGAYDRITFELVGPKGRRKCQWRDAYLGIFMREDSRGAFHTRQFELISDIHCENLENFS